MLRRLAAAGLAAAAFTAAPALAEDFVLDKQHSAFVFIVNHIGYSNVIGRFDDFSGEFTFDEKAPTQAKVAIAIKTASVDTNDKARDAHIASPDFFNAKEFPELTFKSTKVEVTGDKTGKVTGDLTILGVTKPVTLDVTFNKVAPHPLPQYKGVLNAGFSARGSIKRSDWGLKYGVPALGDEIGLIIEVEGQKKG